jgi:DNA polymerase-3 subunit epsilon
MGRCNAPCDGSESIEEYAVHAGAVREAMQGDVRPVVAALSRRVELLADVERFEEAAVHRDRLAAFVRAAARTQRLSALTGCPLVVAARPSKDGAWELLVVRHGRLAGTAVAPLGTNPRAVLSSVLAAAETVTPGVGPTPAASAEETECLLRWLEQPGTRLVEMEGTWASPAFGAGGVRIWAQAAEDGRASSWRGWLDGQRDLRPVHQPAAAVSRIAG